MSPSKIRDETEIADRLLLAEGLLVQVAEALRPDAKPAERRKLRRAVSRFFVDGLPHDTAGDDS